MARTYHAGRWSALTELTLGTPQLAITELMYHPSDGSDYEFLEVSNHENAEVSLAGMTLDGVDFRFDEGVQLGAHRSLVLASDYGSLSQRHPTVNILGEFGGHLANGGERVAIRAPDGDELFAVEYDDEGFWPLGADGMGYSLVPRDHTNAVSGAEGWRASAELGGSPGRPDPDETRSGVVISEVLTDPVAPFDSAVELFNYSDRAVSIGGWFLGDTLDSLLRVRIPSGRVLPAGGYSVLYGPDLASGPEPLRLAAEGGRLYLSSADESGRPTGAVRGITYGAARSNTAQGRHVFMSGPAFVELSEPTFGVSDPRTITDFRSGSGSPNAYPRVGPVVLNEIHYHPAPGASEYVELKNIGSVTEVLGNSDPSGSAIWFSDGIELEFPPGSHLGPGEIAIVSLDDPVEFAAHHDLPDDVQVFGPYSGKLDNAGECVELSGRGVPGDTSGYRAVRLDVICYEPESPWPAAADGQGPSLERTYDIRYGNDPSNWRAFSESGSPGAPNTLVRELFIPRAIVGP
jgi:hypothetical protein